MFSIHLLSRRDDDEYRIEIIYYPNILGSECCRCFSKDSKRIVLMVDCINVLRYICMYPLIRVYTYVYVRTTLCCTVLKIKKKNEKKELRRNVTLFKTI